MRLTLITLFYLSVGCTLNEYPITEEEANSPPNPPSEADEKPTDNIEVILYNYVQADKVEIVNTVMIRWSNATCMDLHTVSEGAPHSISFVPKSELPTGLGGHTGGTWSNVKIRVSDDMTDTWSEVLLMHEVFHHLAILNNDGHTQSGVAATGRNLKSDSKVTEEILTKVCDVRYCLCFNPEI